MIIIAISAALSFAAGAGIAWKLQAGTIAQMESEAKDERLAQQRAAHVLKERNLETVIQAQNAATARAAVLRRDAAAARAGLDGLRDASAAALRTADAGLDACNAVVTAYAVSLAEGAGFAVDVAAAADQCLSDQQTLKDAWPGGPGRAVKDAP